MNHFAVQPKFTHGKSTTLKNTKKPSIKSSIVLESVLSLY